MLTDPKLAARVLGEARGADAEQWRALVAKYNPEALGPSSDKTVARPALGVAGDLGMLNAGLLNAPPTSSAGAAPTEGGVPEVVRRAVFEIAEPGQVFAEPVAFGGRFYVLRLVSKQEARQRSLEEVLPWDHIHVKKGREYLAKEQTRSIVQLEAMAGAI